MAETLRRPGGAGQQSVGTSQGAAGTGGAQEGSVHPVAWLFGVITGITGLLFAVAGVLGEDVTPETMGMVMGMVSYMLGTRRLGAAALIASTAMLVLVLAIGHGDLPGIAGSW